MCTHDNSNHSCIKWCRARASEARIAVDLYCLEFATPGRALGEPQAGADPFDVRSEEFLALGNFLAAFHHLADSRGFRFGTILDLADYLYKDNLKLETQARARGEVPVEEEAGEAPVVPLCDEDDE